MLNKEKLNEIKSLCTDYNAELVAVTKTRSIAELQTLYAENHRIFGENRVQELIEKREQLPDDIQWHLIGHLQRNKVKYIAPFVSMIHAVDSARLLKEINKRAEEAARVIPCLLQFHIAKEDSKYGIKPADLDSFLSKIEVEKLNHVSINGVMGMASFVDDEVQVRKEFQELKAIFKSLKEKHFTTASFNTISMGMSGDYTIALEEGSTLIRIGSALFSD